MASKMMMMNVKMITGRIVPLLATATAIILIFPILLPGSGSSGLLVLRKAEATMYAITTDTTWGDKTLAFSDEVNIANGATLTITGTVCCPGAFRVYGPGTLTVNPGGVLTVNPGGYLLVISGSTVNIAGKLENFDRVHIESGAVLRVNEPGIVHNKGTTSIYGTLNINNGAEFDNYPSDGYIYLPDGGTLKVFTGGYLKNDGTIDKSCRSTFTLNPGASFSGNPITGESCIVINNVPLPEGNSGTKNFPFKVTRSGGTTYSIGLKFATQADTATAGTDYVSKSGTLTFSAGQTSKTVNIVVNGDTTVEPNEKFNVRLSSCNGGCTFLDSKGVGTIKNDD
jgi:hypothetical protein